MNGYFLSWIHHFSQTKLQYRSLLVTGFGDLAYNAKKNLLGAICVSNKTAYYLFSVNPNYSDAKDMVKLSRKSKWHSQYSQEER